MSNGAAANSTDDELARLIQACAARDRQALRRLYELMRADARQHGSHPARRALAEEALQDVFVSIWQRAQQFEAAAGRRASG